MLSQRTSRHRRYCFAAALLVLALSGRAVAAEKAPRVVVLDMVLKGVVGGDASELPDLIGMKLAKRGYKAIGSGEHHRALYETPDLPADCERHDDCRLKLGRILKADFVLATKLSKDRKRYELELTVLHVNGNSKPRNARETMRLRESLPMNVDLCLSRVFDALPEPLPVAEPNLPPVVRPPPVVEPAVAVDPVVNPQPSAPSPPQHSVQCVIDRDCARLTSTVGLPRQCLAEAWHGFPVNTCLACVEGSCSCPTGRTSCGDGVGCIDLGSDPEHCGHCDRHCADGAACVKGECR